MLLSRLQICILVSMQWNHKQSNPGLVRELSEGLEIGAITATVLEHLGMSDTETARRFINPMLKELDDPFRITNLDKVVTRIRQVINNNESVVVFGDYDVDGITSTAFLTSILRVFDVYPHYLVPRRLEEGYGLSRVAIDRALQKSTPDLLIAVDCGTNSPEAVAYLRQHNIDVIIIDHHIAKHEPPDDCLVVNPHVHNQSHEPWGSLCAVGLVFKVVHGLLKQMRDEGDEQALATHLKDYLDLVAMGTIADLVPLRQENRTLTKAGLKRLKNTQRLGLNALFEISGMTLGEDVTPMDISFKLSPRINASGRLNDASLPIDMLLSDDWQACTETARKLNEFNLERRAIEKKMMVEAEDMIADQYDGADGFVLYHADWHPGVVGIVASRVVQKFHRPCIVLGAKGDLAKGSGRSIENVNLVTILQGCSEMLGSWGGHPSAVGVALDPENLEKFREVFSAAVSNSIQGDIPDKVIDIAAWIAPADANGELLNELDLIHPFGQGNPEPVFGIRNIELESPPIRFGQGHFRFQLETGTRNKVFGVAWNQANHMPSAHQPIDLAFKLNWNCWNGRKNPQISLSAWRPSVMA